MATTTVEASSVQTEAEETRRPNVTVHPEFRRNRDNWVRIHDCLEGEREIKRKETDYLPKTSGQKNNGTQGTEAYEAYKERAIYENYPKDTSDAAIGMMSREPAEFVLPPNLESLIENATPTGETLQAFTNWLNGQQFDYGRAGILVDVPEMTMPDVPRLVGYQGFDIVNWAERIRDGKKELYFVLLDESRYEMTGGISHTYTYKYRVCALDADGNYFTQVLCEGGLSKMMTPNDLGEINFMPQVAEGEAVSDPYPNFKGKRLKYIPFTFVNVSNLDSKIEISPILDISDLSIAAYRKSADLEQAYFMQGQSTPYATGITEDQKPTLLGAQAILTSTNPDATFGFMEVSGAGLDEMKKSLDELKQDIVNKGVSLLETGGTESGKALGIRQGAKTNKLMVLVRTGAKAMVRSLSMIYSWAQGQEMYEIAPEEELMMSPNTDFVEDDNSTVADEALKLVQAAAMGYPISKESLHAHATRKELTMLEFEDEMEKIQSETPDIPMVTDPLNG